MSDYTPLGIQKIAQQAGKDPALIRCPRDGVVMRILRACAERQDVGGVKQRTFDRAPKGDVWTVTEVDVECPACRRCAGSVRAMRRPSREKASSAG